MSAFVVISFDDKQGVVNPDIYGPFATDAEAEAFADRVNADALTFVQNVGGYYGIHVVSDATAKDPSEWEPLDEDEEEDAVSS